MCRGVVFIAQERGPKSNLCFRLGCNWKESRSVCVCVGGSWRLRGRGAGWRSTCAGQGGLPLGPHRRFRFLFWVFGNRHPAISVLGREAARALRRTTLAP